MFTLPEDLKSLSAADLDALLGQAREYATQVLTDTPDDVAALGAAKSAFEAVTAEKAARAETDALRAELAAAVAEPVIPLPEPEPEAPPVAPASEPVAVVASFSTTTTTAATADVRVTRSTLDAPAPESAYGGATMKVAHDVPNMPGGQQLTSFRQAAEAVTTRLLAYPAPPKGALAANPAPAKRDGRAYALDLKGRSYVRHSAVVLNRNFPEELQVNGSSKEEFERVNSYANDQKRLPGGSLIRAAEQRMSAGKALTAAVGFCSPSETIYSLCDLSSLDGMLNIAELQAPRGGYILPAHGGPDISVVWNGIGNNGDVILTEYDVENGAQKDFFEIPCTEFEDVRLDPAYVALTASLLQRRTYPEIVQHFTQQAVKVLAHKINASTIQRIALASGPATVIPVNGSGDDAASSILSGAELAITDIRYSQRMSTDTPVELVYPIWALPQVRAAMARRYGIGQLGVTDRMIFDWYSIRGGMPSFVYDWQDSFTGLPTGPGGATPLTALPTSLQFLAYPAGTWTKIVQDIVSLDTIYDNALLRENMYSALFVEDAFNVIQNCPVSRLYTVPANPAGVVGCCP